MGVRKSSEEVIQRALAGLRDCEASPGMERRILEAVRDRASARPATSWYAMRPLAWGLGLVTISVSSMVFVAHLLRPAPTQLHVGATRVASLPAATSGAIAEEQRTKASAPIAHAREITVARKRVPTSATALALLRDLRAPSHPAPEAPLTEEEKILLRIAHTGDAEEFAMLNPEMRARQDAQIEADFQRFIAQSSNPDQQ
jgi:hypothetical protein